MNKRGQVWIAILIFLSLIIGGTTLGWFSMFNSFLQYQFFTPKIVNVQRVAFKESQSYNDGMAQDLASWYVDWSKATPDQKASITQAVLHMTASYDTTRLPPYLESWVMSLRSN